MNQRKNHKKDKNRKKLKIALYLIFFAVSIAVVLSITYLNYSLGRKIYISPLALNNKSKLSETKLMLTEKKISLQTINARTDGSIVAILSDGAMVIFSQGKDIKNQISSLQLILSRLTIDGKRLKSLDFRYDNPIVSF